MKTHIKNPFTCLGAAWACLAAASAHSLGLARRSFTRSRLLPALIAVLGLIPVGRMAAQSYVNSDGADPYAGLILSGNMLYGTALYGGSSDAGTVFAVKTDGTGFKTLHSFTGSDGMNPQAGLTNSGNTLYGTAGCGGPSGNGSVFKVNTDGTGFTTLCSFSATSGSLSTNSNGTYPYGGLILSGSTVIGMAYVRGK